MPVVNKTDDLSSTPESQFIPDINAIQITPSTEVNTNILHTPSGIEDIN
jgi:uncharacterized protein (DUF4213/DUF364 family)